MLGAEGHGLQLFCALLHLLYPWVELNSGLRMQSCLFVSPQYPLPQVGLSWSSVLVILWLSPVLCEAWASGTLWQMDSSALWASLSFQGWGCLQDEGCPLSTLDQLFHPDPLYFFSLYIRVLFNWFSFLSLHSSSPLNSSAYISVGTHSTNHLPKSSFLFKQDLGGNNDLT